MTTERVAGIAVGTMAVERQGLKGHALVVLGVLTLVNTVSQSGGTLLSAVLPLIKAEFGFSDSALGLLTGYGSAVSFALLTLPISHWAARYGNSLVLALSMLVCALTNMMTAGCHALWQLIAARFVSGAGPAAAWPLGQALVAEHFPPHRRSGAMAVYTAGDFVGSTLPLVLGGWLAVQYGWRTAFVVFGLLTLVAPVLQWWLVPNHPAVPVEEGAAADEAPLRWKDGVRELWRLPAYVHIMFGFSWASFAVYGLSQWMPSFYNRQFGLAPDEAAAFFGGAYAAGAMLGLVLGGALGNRIGRGGNERLLPFCMLTYLLTFPCILGVLFAPNLKFAFAAHVAATVFGAMPNGPVLSMLHGSVPRRLRVLGSSIFLLVMTLLGAGGGPLLIGIGSDLLAPTLGPEALKYAMLCVKLLGVLLFVHLGIAWRNARRDAVLTQGDGP